MTWIFGFCLGSINHEKSASNNSTYFWVFVRGASTKIYLLTQLYLHLPISHFVIHEANFFIAYYWTHFFAHVWMLFNGGSFLKTFNFVEGLRPEKYTPASLRPVNLSSLFKIIRFLACPYGSFGSLTTCTIHVPLSSIPRFIGAFAVRGYFYL